jgi:proteasome beta subunit
MNDQLKTGTTTVGIVCKDGIVIAADKRATAGNLIVDKRAEKVHIINDDIAVTIAGSVSEAQLLIKLIRAELKLKEVRTLRKATMKEAANLLGGLLYSNIRKMSMIPGIAHFLMGGRDNVGTHLYDLFPDGSVTLIKDFVSSGSGSVIAYGVLETQYRKDITTKDAIELAIKSINAALQRDSCSGNGIDIAVIKSSGIKKVMEKELQVSL